jgi:cysteine desulfurase
MTTPVYMDYQATTPVDPRVLEAMLPYFSIRFGNPASRQHRFGWTAEEAAESSRASIARSIGAEAREIIFTSGATESNNLAIKGIAETGLAKGNHIVTVQTEHRSVLDCCRRLEKIGFAVTYLPVDEFGRVGLDSLRNALTPKTILVSVMAANNEIGTIHDLAAIGAICREQGVIFHTDASQALGKIPIDVRHMKIDLMSFTGHKVYGPKGVGALFVRASSEPRIRLTPQLDGGGHERGLRSGTLNVPGIVGLANALDIAVGSMAEESLRLTAFRDSMLDAFTRRLGEVALNGHPTERLPNNLNVSFLHVEDNALMMSMKDIAVSTGSACSSAHPEPSHVLKALHIPALRVHSAIRFGLGRPTTAEEVEFVIDRVVSTVERLRSISAPSGPRKVTAVPSPLENQP